MTVRKSTQDRRDEITKATLDLAFDVGPDHVTTGMIATRLGVSQPAIYKHFPKKEDIWLAATHSLCAQIRQNAQSPDPPASTAVDRLRRLILGHLQLVAATPALPEIMTTRDPTDALTQARHAIQNEFAGLRAALLSAFERGQATGQLRSSMPAQDGVSLLLGIMQGLVLRLIISRNPALLVQDGMRLFDMQIKLLSAKGTST